MRKFRNSNIFSFSSQACLKVQKRCLQYQQQHQGYQPNLALIVGSTAFFAAGAGFWFSNNVDLRNMQLKQNSSTITSSVSEEQRPKVTIPKIPTQTTITTAFKALREVLPPEHVSIDEETLLNHGYSTNSYHNEGAPNIVVFPSSTEEVASILKIADRLGLPIIPFSGGTSLEGHFAAPKGGICIDFKQHMDNIVAFHPEDMDIVVQPGLQWEDLNAFLKEQGLFFPMDPGPGACLGGMVGTSCSGTNAVRYGTMRDWVINLTVVTADGKVLKTRQRPRKSSAGYDLTKLFVGSEGTLGLITEITLKLAVLPPFETVAVCDFPSVRDAAAVVPDLVRAGVQIGAVELLDAKMMEATNLAIPSMKHAAKPTLFFKFSGASKVSVNHDIQVVSEITNKHHGGQFKYAKSEQEKEKLWEARKIALWSSTLLKPNASVWTTDVVVPVSKLPELIAETTEDVNRSFLPCPMVGHVGDGNFHVFILFDKSNEKEFEEAKRINENLLRRAIRMEGSVTGEHGVGVGKKAFLNEELGENTVNMMKKIKIAFDPKGLMNPEKVLPD